VAGEWIDALTLAARTDIVVVDIRPRDERETAGLGEIPGALCIADDVAVLAAELPPECVSALVCLTGHRARTVAKQLEREGNRDVRVLSGGILGWRDADLPVVCPRLTHTHLHAASIADLPRLLLSCFVGQIVDTAVTHEMELAVAPDAMLRACFERAGESWDAPSPAGLRRIIEYAGSRSRAMGTDLDTIAVNQSHFLQLLNQLEVTS